MSVETYVQEQNSDGVGWYLAGLLNGYSFANIRLEDIGEIRLYCPPKDLPITVADARKLIFIKMQEYDQKKYPDLWIEPMLLRQLRTTYPCK